MSRKRRSGCFMISTVAETYNIHPQTLRLYERLGLLRPSRSDGNTRLYTDRDLERLETILNLTRALGVNLAGVEVVLNMREKMEQMQLQLDEIIAFVREDMAPVVDSAAREALVRVPPSTLIRTGQRRK